MRVTTTALALLVLGIAGGSGCGAPSSAGVVEVYKSPTCGCCEKWVDHLEANGFEVHTTDVPDVAPVKAEKGVPRELA